MTDLPKLQLKPLRESYSFALGQNVISTEMQAGMPRQRLSAVGTTHRVNATYQCTKSQWQYMLAFLRANRARAFLAYLLLDDIEPRWYECRVIPSNDGLQASTTHEVLYSIELPLIAKAMPIDDGKDEVIALLYTMSRSEQDAYFNHLEKLVNHDLARTNKEHYGN